MNAFLRKEIRLLLPSFVIALLLTFSFWLIPAEGAAPPVIRNSLFLFPFLLCPAVVMMMALNSFGREVSAGTFSNLLAQPVARARIWWTKAVLLAVALAVIFCAWWFSCLLCAPIEMSPAELRDTSVGTALFLLVTYSGGLWAVLLFRQVAVAFWFTLIVPGAILATIGNLLAVKHPELYEPVLVSALVIYSAAGFLFAWWLFLRAQDVQWTGGTIALPGWLRVPRLFVRTEAQQGRRPRAALLAKEFQLHQSQLVIAGVLALLHLGVIATRKLGGGFKDSPVLEIVLPGFWGLWFVMPLLIGCAAVAEERKLGTWEGQLCLPASRRTQFTVKFVVALLLAVLLGAVVPLLFEGSRILPNIQYDFSRSFNDRDVLMPGGIFIQTVMIILEEVSVPLPFLALAGLAAAVAAIAFYASTLARNTLQALAPAVLGFVVTWALLLGAYRVEDLVGYPLWRGWLVYFLGVPVMTLTLAWLAGWNFKHALVGWNVWRRNVLAFLTSLALVIAVTTAVYHRAWELVAPIEPPHGAPRLAQSQAVTMWSDGMRIAVQLPDGRIWSDRFILSVPNRMAMLSGNWRVAEGFGGGRFLEGTNWISAAMCRLDVVAIQKDGSLWVSEQPDKSFLFWRRARSTGPGPIKLVRHGTDTDWKGAAGNYTSAFLLKTDGTLWRLGTNNFNWRKSWPGLHAFQPQRLGSDSDWAEISSTDRGFRFRKTDGRMWEDGGSAVSEGALRLDAETILKRTAYLDGHQWRGVAWSFAPRIGGFRVGVREDGTLRVNTDWQMRSFPTNLAKQWGLVRQDVQLGKESNWLAVSVNGGIVLTLKADGSMWKWSFPDDPVTKPDTASAVLLSRHSDWIAMTSALGGVVSLATDGSLWFWRFEPLRYFPPDSSFPPLLAVSRRPQKIGNIFGSSTQ